MKRMLFLSLIGGLLVLTSCGQNNSSKLADNSGSEPMEILIESGHITADSLKFMREEEKLARDVYITLFNRWGLAIFDNISESEQVHTDRVKSLLNKYNIEDPAANTGIGEFVNPKIQEYYSSLVDRGSTTSLEALYVGAYIEELDIGDLRLEIEHATTSDVAKVYTNLMNGSYNHLRAFVGQIENTGITYTAQILDQSDVDSILGK